jgi:hypothetical protein
MVTTSYVSAEMERLHVAARDAGITILNECGLDPGARPLCGWMGPLEVCSLTWLCAVVVCFSFCFMGGRHRPFAGDGHDSVAHG